jgi:hypothetical protein
VRWFDADFVESSRSSYIRLDITGCGMFKVFGGGLWLIFQDDNYFGAIKKLTALRWIIYIEFVKRSEGM